MRAHRIGRGRGTVLGLALVLSGGLLSACGGDDPAPPTKAQPPGGSSQDAATPTAGSNGEFPEFSDPTAITNPWFPLSQLKSYELVGTEEGKPYKAEIDLLPRTKTIEWAGGSTEVAVARHRSYLKGELVEIAWDYYAQGDDGGVWYFGEDVNFYKNGKVVNHEGAWLAGQGGAPPGLLIPGKPRPGQVFWSEDHAEEGIIERDKVIRLDESVKTPEGTSSNGLLVRAIQDDGTKEEKTYVRGLGVVLEVSEESQLRLAS